MATLGYVRVSTTSQALNGYGLEMQKSIIRKRDRRAVIFEDNGISGIELKRPGLQALLAAIRPGDTVLVPSIDRLWRSELAEATIKQKLRATGCKLESIKEPQFALNAATPTEALISNLLADLAAFDHDCIISKLTTARRQKKESGLYVNGRAPLGYKWQTVKKENGGQSRRLVIDTDKQEQIKRAFELKSWGKAYRFIIEQTGLAITPQGLCKLLKNPLYKGQGAPAIVSTTLWNKANRKAP